MARALPGSGVRPGDKVAVLSGNDPLAFACVFGLSRAGAVWCPINPRNEAAENRFVLDAFDCRALIFHSAYEALVERMRSRPAEARRARLPRQGARRFAPSLESWLDGASDAPIESRPSTISR